MARPNPCPRCGVDRPAGSLAGLCPRCLLEQGLLNRPSGASVTRALDARTPEGDGPRPEAGVLATLAASIGGVPRVLLRETGDADDVPPARPSSPEMPARVSDVGRYQLLGEIARGGMGAVLKGRDVDLGRDLAVKVLLDTHKGNPELIRRFVEEAQIGGQLQHPGIVPVYELGQFADLRPFFTMKLVKGRTLAALLRERPGPEHDRPSFLSTFEAACQTVAYAHSRGVIHRDLKPSNVMVGAFGEVQVMDWGLAKVLPQGGVADERTSPLPEASVIQTVRSGSEADASQAGSVLGTPAYMAPEQARGEVREVDERADVFGLGAILCEILTGQPPFLGRSGAEILGKVRLGDMAEARARLDASGAEVELVALARRCLMPLPADRPRSASDVAGAVTGYLAGVQRRLRRAELAQLEERARRRLTVAVAAALLIIGGLVGGGGYWIERGRAERRGVVLAALERARLLLDQARAAPPEEKGPWDDVARAAEQVAGLIRGGGTGLEGEAAGLRRVVEAEKLEADSDRELLGRLADIRVSKAETRDGAVTDADYAATFRAAGLDLDTLPPDRAAEAIAGRPPALRPRLIGYLDDWAHERRRSRPRDEAGWQRLVQIARALDPDPRRDRLRALWPERDLRPRVEPLRAMALGDDIAGWPLPSLGLLATSLAEAGDPAAAADLLGRAVRTHPHDLWLNFELASTLEKCRPPRTDEAIRFYTAARALRPESGHELAHALNGRGRGDDAVAILRDLTALRPNYGKHWLCLGVMLGDRGDRPGSSAALDRGIERMEAERLARPDNFAARSNLGQAYWRRHRLDEALARSREALALRPDDGLTHVTIGHVFEAQGRLDEAIVEFREAIRITPDDPVARDALAAGQFNAGRFEEAAAAAREAIRLGPGLASAHYNLGISLDMIGKKEEAIASFREAIRLRPDFPPPHNVYGAALAELGRHEEAITSYQEALRLKPDFAEAHANLGTTLRALGRYPEAAAAFRRGVELLEGQPYRREIEDAWRAAERLAALDARLSAVLRGEDRPGGAERIEFAELCYHKQLYAATVRLYQAAFAADPSPSKGLAARHRYDAACVAVLAGTGRGRDRPPTDEAARAAFRRQALAWLEAELGELSAAPGRSGASAQDRDRAIRSLRRWREDPDLAGIRDPDALGTLPEADREACRALWDAADRRLKQIAASP